MLYRGIFQSSYEVCKNRTLVSKQMSLLAPILEGRISNFHQIWEGFLVVRSTTRNSFPNIPSVIFGVSTFYEEKNEKSKFPAQYWL